MADGRQWSERPLAILYRFRDIFFRIFLIKKRMKNPDPEARPSILQKLQIAPPKTEPNGQNLTHWTDLILSGFR